MKLGSMLVVLAASAALLCGPGFAQAPTGVRVRGEIVAVDATTLTVQQRSNGGVVKIALKPDQAVGALKKIAVADIKPGSYIGTATKTNPEGQLIAMEVIVLPESARGSGEGHYEWDLAPGSMMTNGNVDNVVEGVNGRTLKLSYKGGTKDVTVPEGIPVVVPAPATRADLLVGKKVFAFAQGDPSSLSANRITVEKDGVAPPM
ncbi:MAG TPA: hypothetical protein VN663_10550 [Ramlibacter sp.]|nr:hypothetical protein [Ramlibacter sp.]